ncbi:helix-turn-helix domain-containing protein [Streptomyces sp. SID4919]|uniref:helix-turn-helix domain-containing protein n=1 Tax=unclassified Streptomyces TaxID=2593676 RepID=UPI000823ADAF|nr:MULTISPECIES: helix-turn-helix domain-containing protein [unclassified Streptomyces]MYY10049.1 helix-turn-helix domain-containing protein [Streptomyces sp. SID4919]SCK50076.1 Predicted transcriptional regulators [Streptomyces sp. AmelKG-E11A]
MSELPEDHIGRRLRSARRQRGVSLRALAGLSGLSTGFLSMVENGHRHLDRTGHITALAEALRMAPSELTGQSFASTGPQQAESAHAAIPVLRLALMGMTMTAPPDRSAPDAPPSALADRVRAVNRLYHAAEYGKVASGLPALLADLHAAVEAAADGGERRRLLRLLADAYHPACTLLLKNLGYTDLAFIAVTRAAEAIAELDDPVHTALSGFFHTHVLMAAGSPVQALARADRAANQVERHLSGLNAHALLGELHLIRATCLTQDVRRSGADRAREVAGHLSEAADLAGRTGETKAWHLNFGPTNVGIHEVSLNTDLGLHGAAVAARRGVHPRVLEAPGREAAFHADLGRSLAHLRGRDTEAATELLTAERAAPQRIHANALVRGTVSDLLDRQLPSHAARDLRGLAHRMGLQA